VPLAAASERGALVANLPGINAQSVAEYCVMAMLMLSRRVIAITSTLRGKTWDEARVLGAEARELAGMTVGIVGVGQIGTRVARICHHGFNMRVLGHQRRLENLPAEARPAELDWLLAESQFVIVSCPLTAETRHLFDEKRIGRMK